ncbi:MAG: CUB domain-containing protein, partial [Bacteroidia bacterium]|nr:CUB domain-containing protein [Bacteroidia bacterium]
MNKKLLLFIFILLSVFFERVTAQNITMSNGASTTYACTGGTFYDPGGTGNYANSLTNTQTICAPAGQYLTFTFTSFNTESCCDDLDIYNGPNTGSPLIGTFAGTNTPGTITVNPGQCITFSFTSDGSITAAGWTATMSCSTTPPPPPPPVPGACSSAQPFCTSTGVTFPAATNTTAPAGPNYGCLLSQPNPQWYYLNIASAGNIQIGLTNSSVVDIDFALWGPFATQASMCGGVTAAPIDCSFSTAAVEQVDITGATVGQWYMLLITNFSNVPTNITATAQNAPGTDGTTNCNILCNMTGLTATPGACVPATNTYSVTGSITVQYPPTSGTLTVSSSCGGSTTIPSPWVSPIAYTLPGITANGGACSITATFSADPTCSLTTAYTSPAPCNGCTLTAGNT